MISEKDIEDWSYEEDEDDPILALEDWLWELDSFRLSYDWTEGQEADIIAAMNCLARVKSSLTDED